MRRLFHSILPSTVVFQSNDLPVWRKIPCNRPSSIFFSPHSHLSLQPLVSLITLFRENDTLGNRRRKNPSEKPFMYVIRGLSEVRKFTKGCYRRICILVLILYKHGIFWLIICQRQLSIEFCVMYSILW